MNEYILKVMVWLRDKNFYSKEVLKKNYADAYYAYAIYTVLPLLLYSAASAAHAVYFDSAASTASYWVNKFFKLSGDDRQQYEQEVNRRLAA